MIYNLERRALSAYWRTGATVDRAKGSAFIYATPAKGRGLGTAKTEHHYVHLGNINGTLAVYRVLYRSTLECLKRRPSPMLRPNRERNREAVASTIKGTIEAFRGDAHV